MINEFELAIRFIAELKAELNAGEWAEMQRRNALETSPQVCHSHDFCDANESMARAWVKCGGKDEDVLGNGPEHDAARLVWGNAWDRAMPALGGKQRRTA